MPSVHAEGSALLDKQSLLVRWSAQVKRSNALGPSTREKLIPSPIIRCRDSMMTKEYIFLEKEDPGKGLKRAALPAIGKNGRQRPPSKPVDSARPQFPPVGRRGSKGGHGVCPDGVSSLYPPCGATAAAVRTWLRADEANFVKCASGTGPVKRSREGERRGGSGKKASRGSGTEVIPGNMGLDPSPRRMANPEIRNLAVVCSRLSRSRSRRDLDTRGPLGGLEISVIEDRVHPTRLRDGYVARG